MKNPFIKEETNPLVPLLIGVAIGGVLALLFAPDSGTETRGSLVDSAKKGWDAIKENMPISTEDLNSFKDKVFDAVRTKVPEDISHNA